MTPSQFVHGHENGVLNVSAEYGLGCFDAVFSPVRATLWTDSPLDRRATFYGPSEHGRRAM